MVSQYPDSIVITVAASASQSASSLLWTAGATANHTFDCRAEINGSGRRTPGPDGQMIDYAYMCYMPKTSLVIPFGSPYILNGVVIGTVKGASNGQLNSRLWL